MSKCEGQLLLSTFYFLPKGFCPQLQNVSLVILEKYLCGTILFR